MSDLQLTAGPVSRQDATDTIAAQLRFLVLAAMVVYVTMFDSMWIGQMPLWLLLPVIGVAVCAHFPIITRDFITVVSKLEWRVIVPWIVYVAIVAIFLFARGTFEAEAGRRVVLTSMQLVALLIAATLAYSMPPRRILYLIAAIAAFQGIVCIGQVLQVPLARQIPDLFFSLGGSATDVAQSGNPYDAIKEMVRARGTLLLVHKFNPMQGMLAALLVTFSLAGGKFAALKLRYNRLFIAAGAFVGTIGMVLTFSRSTVLGMGATLLAISWCSTKNNRLFRVAIVLSLIAAAAVAISVASLPILGRLLSSDPYDPENASRTKQVIYTWRVLWESPIFGAPMPIGPGEYPVHSVLFRVFTDFGLIGAIPYLIIVLGILFLAWRYARSADPIVRLTGLACFGMMMMVVSDGWTHSSGLIQADVTQCVLLGIGLGMMFSAERNALVERERLRRQTAASAP